jgi:hypothetical protein
VVLEDNGLGTAVGRDLFGKVEARAPVAHERHVASERAAHRRFRIQPVRERADRIRVHVIDMRRGQERVQQRLDRRPPRSEIGAAVREEAGHVVVIHRSVLARREEVVEEESHEAISLRCAKVYATRLDNQKGPLPSEVVRADGLDRGVAAAVHDERVVVSQRSAAPDELGDAREGRHVHAVRRRWRSRARGLAGDDRAPLRDDRRDEVRGRHVKRRIGGDRAGGRRTHTAEAEDLASVALLDLDVLAPRGRRIDGRLRCGDDEGDAGAARGERVSEGSDLVGDIPVRSDPVRAHDDGVDVTADDETRGRAIDDQAVRDAHAPELPCGEASALKQRPRLAGIGELELVHPVKGGDHRERGPVLDRGQAARVAVGQDAPAPNEQSRAAPADGRVRRDVGVPHGQRRRQHTARPAGSRRAGTLDAPGEVHGRRARTDQ